MSTMTFRARDSVTALEQVQRRLGPDALILSNDLIDGQVVIIASDDAPDSLARPMPRFRPVPVPEPEPEPALVPVPAAASVDIVIDDPIDPIAPHAPVATTAAPRLPSFLSPDAPNPFERMLDKAKATEPAPPHTPEDPSPALPDPLILRDRLLNAPRIVLVGPAGAGKSQVALQLALTRLARKPASTVKFCFCGTGSHSDGAFLAQKSHLLGMETLFETPDTLAAPEDGTLQIVVISGRGGDGPALGRAALSLPEARAAMVMPVGLRPDRIKSLKQRWAGLTEAAILSDTQDATIDAEDQAALSAAGLVPLWDSVPDQLVEGLHVIEDTPKMDSFPSDTDIGTDPKSPVLFRRHGTEPEART
ncbi:hypothetical protein [Roseovarius sp.]|uniref:hypothetical protein n=1 Tax=Roseovarius sp. TaxID=1486281 RepID=UPI003A971920